jgi:hypothetical protein
MADTRAPSLLQVVEVAIGNAIPVFGVIFLGWPAIAVVFLYVLDGWFCILALGASVLIKYKDEFTPMFAKYRPVRRAFAWAASVAFSEAILSIFAIVPGIFVLASMEGEIGDALVAVFAARGTWTSVALLAGSHGMRLRRGVQGNEDETASMDPKDQLALFVHRLAVMMFFAWLAGPGVLSRYLTPVFVALVAALFTVTDLYPRRYLEKLKLLAAASGSSSTPPPKTR